MDKIPVSILYEDNQQKLRSYCVSYYGKSANEGSSSGVGGRIASNRRRDDCYLAVNCTGRVDIPFRFTTSEPQGRHDTYLMYMLGGTLDALVDGEQRRLVPGDAVFFPPEKAYHYTKSSPSSVQYLWVHFTGSGVDAIRSRYGFDKGAVYPIGIDEGISRIFMELIDDFIRLDDYYEDSAANRLVAILVAMRRRMDSRERSDNPANSRVFTSLKYIHDHFTKPISNETLAALEHLCISQYIDRFRSCTGTTPRAYVIELRLQSACDLLHTSDLSVAQIAQSVGYDDPHYFSRIFKQHRGVSPEIYRMGGPRV